MTYLVTFRVEQDKLAEFLKASTLAPLRCRLETEDFQMSQSQIAAIQRDVDDITDQLRALLRTLLMHLQEKLDRAKTQ